MSPAKVLGLNVPDAELMEYLIRNADSWESINATDFAVNIHAGGIYLLSSSLLNNMDTHLKKALIFLRDNNMMKKADTHLMWSLATWGYTKAPILYNNKLDLWERWIKVDYEEISKSYNITKNLYRVQLVEPDLPVVTENIGKLDMGYHVFEIDVLYPGFNSVFTVADQLGLTTLDRALHCQKFVAGLTVAKAPLPPLPDFN